MKIAIIGRTKDLYDTAVHLHKIGHEICCILTAKEAPEYTCSSEDFRVLAQKWQIPFVLGGKILEHSEFLRNASADIGVSINYTSVIPQFIIDFFPNGILNVHGGDLPRYRGNACQAWAILNGESKIGLCVHRMIGEELDSGDIITRDYLTIDHNTKITSILQWMQKQTPSLMAKALSYLMDNADYVLEIQSKNIADTLRCYPRCPDDGRISWSKPVIDVLRLVNASNSPYAGAFCKFEGEKMIIWDAELVEEENFCAVPGQVAMIGDNFIEVTCGKGKLRILSVEYKGKVSTPNVWVKSIRKRLL